MNAPTKETFGRVLLVALDGDPILTDSVQAILMESWGELPAAEIGKKTVVDMAFDFKATFPAPSFSNGDRLRIAESVHALLTRARCVVPEPVSMRKPSAAPSTPPPVPAPPAVDYQRMVLEAALSDCVRSGSSMVVGGGPYRRVRLTGSSIRVKDLVVVVGGTITGSSASGTVYVPPGVDIAVCGSNSNVDVRAEPWEKIARRIGLVSR